MRVRPSVCSSLALGVALACDGCAHQRPEHTSLADGPGFSRAAFPLALSADRRYLVDRSGAPFLIEGDAAWSLIAKLRREDAETYLEDRRMRGFDAVLVNLIEHKFAEHPPCNAYGQAPFATGGEFTSPNEPYFAYADAVLRIAADKGIAVMLAPAYLGQGGGDEGFYREMAAAGPAALKAYGAYLGRRYAAFDNVVWVLGGDFTPPSEGLALVRALGEGIRSTGGARQLFTAHFGAETSAQDIDDAKVRSWLDLDSTYTYRPVYEKSLADYRRPGALPHFLIETAYEHEHESTPRSLRTQAYDALLTGAVGQFFGNGGIWGFWGWRSELASPGAQGMTHLRRLFEAHAWMELVPDDAHEVLTAGAGESGTNDYALLALSKDGRWAVAYLPTIRAVTIDLGKLAPRVEARWYDPSSGIYAPATGPGPGPRGPTVYRPAGPNAVGDGDWVLVFEPGQ